MAILIDPPAWPAHGTYFSHLVSDESLAELHEFAAAAGVPERAFDEDHYDVPERRFADLVARGAEPVDGGTLVRRLIASGLRVRARERSGALAGPLLRRWTALLPEAADTGAELLDRWAEPHRRYHNRAHLLAVLEALDALGNTHAAPHGRTVELAAWFHDAVYAGRAGEDEEASASLAEDLLGRAGHDPVATREVARLVRLTAGHRPGRDDLPGALLCDADLSVLGRDSHGYRRYQRAVRAEYAHVAEPDFLRGRTAVVEHLLGLDPLFHTSAARALWLEPAMRNLAAEHADLRRRLEG